MPSGNTPKDYGKIAEWERQKSLQGYKRIKKFRYFWLMGKYDREGKLLYRECFNRIDIEGVPKSMIKRERQIHTHRKPYKKY